MAEVTLRVEQLAVGDNEKTLLKQARISVEFNLEGLVGDKHAGFIRPADGRDDGVKRGTPVRNWRQWSAVSVEELHKIAERLRIDHLDPSLLGANLTFSGCDDLTLIPKGSMIWFTSGAVLTVEGENGPCIGPGKEIAKKFEHVEASSFPKAAKKLRGLVGVVYRAGTVKVGDTAVVRIYEPHDALVKPPQAR
ncbi:MAG TPA: MOSC domain-containing protein [Candidatus Obscuribacterales bacterium]